MKIGRYIKNILWKKDKKILEIYNRDVITNNYYKILAVEASVNLIAKTLARAEIQTFEKGKEVKKINYYMLNVEANRNKSAYIFWTEVVRKILLEGEALIIMQNNQLYLADSFIRKEKAFVENIYEEIIISDYKLKEIKYENEVIYIKEDNEKIRKAIDNIYNDYSSLIESSKNGYMGSKVRKGIFTIPMNYSKTFENEEMLKEHLKNITKDFMNPKVSSILPITNDSKYEEVADFKGGKTNDISREIKNFIDDIFDYVSMSFGIPAILLRGSNVDMKDALNDFLTFCIKPLSKLITDEINRKMYRKKLYLEDTYVKIDVSSIKSVDLRDIANSLELLTRTGSNTIDDNLRILGREPLNNEIGKMRFITKNLGTVESVLKEEKFKEVIK